MSTFVPVQPQKKNKPIYLRLPEDLRTALEKVAEQSGINTSELIRQMISHCLESVWEKEKK